MKKGKKKVNWYKYSEVKQGRIRTKILILLAKSKKPLSAKEMITILKRNCEKCNPAYSGVTRVMHELLLLKLVQCINPTAPYIKLYMATAEGKNIAKLLAME